MWINLKLKQQILSVIMQSYYILLSLQQSESMKAEKYRPKGLIFAC